MMIKLLNAHFSVHKTVNAHFQLDNPDLNIHRLLAISNLFTLVLTKCPLLDSEPVSDTI